MSPYGEKLTCPIVATNGRSAAHSRHCDSAERGPDSVRAARATARRSVPHGPPRDFPCGMHHAEVLSIVGTKRRQSVPTELLTPIVAEVKNCEPEDWRHAQDQFDLQTVTLASGETI